MVMPFFDIPVSEPIKPMKPMFAKTLLPGSDGSYIIIDGCLLIGAVLSQSSALRWYTLPSAVAGPHTPTIEQAALIISGR